MSSDSVIEEDILEQIDEESADGDDEGEDTGIKTNVIDSEIIEEKSVEQLDELSDTEFETAIKTNQEPSDLKVDSANKISIAVLNYSGLLAESVLQEALLINEIYTKDNLNTLVDENKDRDRDIRKHLFPNENGRIPSKENGAGYDSYLLDKLLRSKADPEEVTEVNGFDGNEEHFRSNDETYPGLDSNDAYVKAELDRAYPDREFSDKNNNQMTPGLADPFDENILQTIHEDSELVIEDSFRANNVGAIDEVAGANTVHIPSTNEEIGEADDEKSTDDEMPQELDEKLKEVPPSDKEEMVKTTLDSNKELSEVPQDDNNEKSIEEVPIEDDVSEASDNEPSDCCEMTFKEKQAVVKAVRKGDIHLLEKLLEKKNADMSMTWYGENLLMVAVRSEQQEMAEFLIDNGIDWQYERKLLEMDGNGIMSVHKITSRQMAYDLNMEDLVELLDYKMNNLFPFVKPKPRIPRLREPIVPFAPPSLDEAMHEEFLIDPEEAKRLQKQAVEQYKQRQKEIELENLEMMQRRRKGLTSGAENESVHTAKSKHTCSDLNIIHDDISQVFGPDEGYETMSPVSPHRQDYRVPDMKEHVSIRATRSYHLKKAFTASKSDRSQRMDSPDYPMYQNLIETVGSYNFESRRWHHPMSAPQLRNYSVESIPDQFVNTSLPFVHDGPRKTVTSSSERKNIKQRRSQSAHSNISPYSQVAKLLEESRLFSPIISSRSSTPYFPAISNKKRNGSAQTNTRINYIYADRSSAKPKRSDFSSLKTDLLPKRKLKC